MILVNSTRHIAALGRNCRSSSTTSCCWLVQAANQHRSMILVVVVNRTTGRHIAAILGWTCRRSRSCCCWIAFPSVEWTRAIGSSLSTVKVRIAVMTVAIEFLVGMWSSLSTMM
jgi:hypothetical protein